MIQISQKQKNEVLIQNNFTCQKCGFFDESGEELDIKNNLVLCSVCSHFSPDDEKEFQRYLSEKIDGQLLETFRKFKRSNSKKTILGMEKKSKAGSFISKAPLGYSLLDKKLVINAEQAEKVKQIFNEFLTTQISLTQLAKKQGLTTSGLIKLLKNTTYIGKVKFAEQESQGNHQAILDKQLFEQVQDKLNSKHKQLFEQQSSYNLSET